MSLWVDKYRPSSLDQLDYHQNLTDKFKQMALTSEFPHLLIYGPSGSGKKTRISAVLKELFGSGVEKLKIENRQFTLSSNRKIDINIVSSNYHVEITPSDLGNNDRSVIQDLIKEMAQTKQLDASAKQNFKVVVFNEADNLSRGAQAALRRTMEKYMINLRVILCCNVTSKIIAPIRSRCLMIRVAAPSTETICEVLNTVSRKESIELPEILARKIAVCSEGNLRKAILMMEASYAQKYPFSESMEIPTTDWELFVKDIATSILQDQSPKWFYLPNNSLQDTRGKLYALLSNCIPPEVIIKNLTFEFLKNIDSQLKPAIVKYAAEYEHRMRLGSKAIFHLEAYCAKLMSVYAHYLLDIMG